MQQAKVTVTLEKVENVKGAKKTADGRFVDLMWCPYCEKHVESLMACLRENHS